MRQDKPKIALVLSAGSARGIAHIGVIQVLVDNNIPIDLIVGSSMGAMIGGIFAAGANIVMLDKMFAHMDINIFYDIHLPRLGFIAGRRIKYFLDLMTKNKTFSDLDIPLIAVATDLVSGQRVLLEEGSVSEAIRASISIPGVFKPVMRDNMILVDGGVIDRLPIEVARSRGAEIIIAVEVNCNQSKEVHINNALDVIMTSLDIMQKQQFDTVATQADILIKPEVGRFSPRDFDKVRQLVDLGKTAAQDSLEEIRQKIETCLAVAH